MNLNINKTGEERCGCGRLLAVRVPGGVEIRCSRCKTAVVLPLDTEVHKGEKPC